MHFSCQQTVLSSTVQHPGSAQCFTLFFKYHTQTLPDHMQILVQFSKRYCHLLHLGLTSFAGNISNKTLILSYLHQTGNAVVNEYLQFWSYIRDAFMQFLLPCPHSAVLIVSAEFKLLYFLKR